MSSCKGDVLSLVLSLSGWLSQGRRPRGDWGDGPPTNLRWGNGPCIRPPNILRSSVVGSARKYEQRGEKVLSRNFFSEIVVFLVKKGLHRPTIFNIVKKGLYTIFNTVNTRKIRKTWSMTKRRSSEILGPWKWQFFLKKRRHSEILVREKMFRPPKLGARSPPLDFPSTSVYFFREACWHHSCRDFQIVVGYTHQGFF